MIVAGPLATGGPVFRATIDNTSLDGEAVGIHVGRDQCMAKK